MTAKEFLGRSYYLSKHIESDLIELEEAKALVDGITGMRGNAGRNPNRATEASFVGALKKIEELESRIESEMSRLAEEKGEIREVINQVPDTDMRMLLRYRYVLNLPWNDIMGRMGYKERWIHALRNKAERAVEEILADKEDSR